MSLTFEQKKKKTSGKYVDRQNTKWAKEIAGKCNHDWRPVLMMNEDYGQPDINSARTYCICMKCCSHTYIETGWVGYYIGSPDLLEEEEE